MKQNLLENKINQTLYEFENLSNLTPSSDWEHDLMEKISSKRANSSGRKYIILVASLILINVSFLIVFSKNETVSQVSQKSVDLKNISDEFLISTKE